MKRKFFLSVLFMLISGLFTMIFAIDCWQQLTLAVDAASLELAADQSHCDNIADFYSDWCYKEADLNFNSLIDQALANFDDCMGD